MRSFTMYLQAKAYIKEGNSFRIFKDRYVEVNDKNQGLNEVILKRAFNQVQAIQSYHCDLLVYLFIPLSIKITANSEVMSKFISLLKRELEKEYNIKRVAYIWAKEISKKLNEHYHFCLMVDSRNIRSITKLKSIVSNIWIQSGGQDWKQGSDKLFRPFGVMRNDIYKLNRHDTVLCDDLLYRLSYSAKVFTKSKNGSRTFGASNLKPRTNSKLENIEK